MNVYKKLGAMTLAIVLAFALCVPAFAAKDLTDGEVGGFTTPDIIVFGTADGDKVVNIKKEITAFNPDSKVIYGPAITYTYTITPGQANISITDETTDHTSNMATTMSTLAGITTGVTVNGGTPGTTENASGTLEWTNADLLSTNNSNGVANYKDIVVSFADVVFTAPGVYRYVITESFGETAYAASGVTNSTSHTRYLDVYVKRAENYSNSNTAADWVIYGYVCTIENDAITPDGDTATMGAVKTNGFVSAMNDGTAVNADQYHTFNLTVGKTLTGDASMENHPFPFDVEWTNTTATGTFQFIAETGGDNDSNVVITTSNAPVAAATTLSGASVTANSIKKVGGASAVGTADKDGIVSIPNGATVTYIGIPTGTKVKVTETNDVAGTTYTTSATEAIGSATAAAVAFSASVGTILDSTNQKTATLDTNDKAIYEQASAPTEDSNVVIQFTNKLALISPTGVTLRYAPYLLTLGAGIVALPLTKSYRKREDF